MRKDLGKVPAVYPMPVLIVAAYDENGTVQAMNAAWGMISGMDKIALFINEDHATTKAIRQTPAAMRKRAPTSTRRSSQSSP